MKQREVQVASKKNFGPKATGKLDFSKKNLEEVTTSFEYGSEDKIKQTGTIIFSNNKIKKFDINATFLNTFSSLTVLQLNGNALSELPDSIGLLVSLEQLNVENNLLKSLPRSIGNLRDLRKLILSNNEITELPDEIGNLRCLEVLHLTNNKLRVLSPFICSSYFLKELAIAYNPIECPPPFIYNKGMSHLMRYMKESQAALLMETPSDEFMFTRKISFETNQKSVKRLTTKQNLRLDQQDIKQSDKEAAKAVKEISKKGSKLFTRDVNEESVSLNQNYLLYFLLEHGSCDEQGRRDYMEDRFVSFPRLHQRKCTTLIDEVVNLFSKVSFFGVYDGHGGELCAEYLRDHLHQNICNTEEFKRGDFVNAIKNGFKRTDEDFCRICRYEGLLDGSTCLVVMVVDNKLYAAHAGDSRAILCRDRKAYRLTEDHKPDRVDELARIEEAGGEVIYRGNCFRVSGDLAMSRSFGDLRLKEPLQLVICDPEMRVEELTPKDQFIILASDGLWDVLSEQKAVDIVRKAPNVVEAARRLVEVALTLGTMDNTTAVVVKLNWNLDFLTREEIEGKISIGTPKTERKKDKEKTVPTSPDKNRVSREGDARNSGEMTPPTSEPPSPLALTMRDHESEEISDELLERARTLSFSFRDGLESQGGMTGQGGILGGQTSPSNRFRGDSGGSSPLGTSPQSPSLSPNFRKSIYLPTGMNAITCKLLIPHIGATKTMKFDSYTKVKDVIRVIILKHRFTGGIESFMLIHKGIHEAMDLPLEMERTLGSYHIKDRDTMELRIREEKEGEVSVKPSLEDDVAEPGFTYSEALPPSELQEQLSLRRNSITAEQAPNLEALMEEKKGKQQYLERSGSSDNEQRVEDQNDSPSSTIKKSPSGSSISRLSLNNSPRNRASVKSPRNMALRGGIVPGMDGSTPKEENNVDYGEPPSIPNTPRETPNPEPVESLKLESKKPLFTIEATLFILEGQHWRPIANIPHSTKLSIYETEAKFRLISIDTDKKVLLNASIIHDRNCKKISDTFCSFPTNISGSNVIYGIQMKTIEDMETFMTSFDHCLQRLLTTSSSHDGTI